MDVVEPTLKIEGSFNPADLATRAGVVRSVITDQGSQIVAASEVSPDWHSIQHSTAPSGTCWRFVPATTPWRNGLAERVIGLMKRSLRLQLEAGALINYAELGMLLHKVAAIMNARPLSARAFTESDFMATTPQYLLLGAVPCLKERELEGLLREPEEQGLGKALSKVDQKVELWWRSYMEDVFPLLVPRRAMRLQPIPSFPKL